MQRILLIFIVSCQLSVISRANPTTHYPLTNSQTHKLTGLPLPSHAVPRNVNTQRFTPVDSLWLQVDSLVQSGLPNSALSIVDQLYQDAKKAGNDPQLVKAIIYRIGLNSTFQENFPLPEIEEVKQELATSTEPVVQILHSILGELYWSYYQRNQYRLRERPTVSGSFSDDPETWDSKRLVFEIILNYRQSLSNENSLQEIPIEQYRAIVDRPVLGNGKPDTLSSVHPTLFDFLAYRALQFFTQKDVSIIQPAWTFRIDNPIFFGQTPVFIMVPMRPGGIHARPGDGPFIPPGMDTLSLPWYAIRIYQAVAEFHLDDKNPDALIDWELQRFSYVRSESTLPKKDSLYLEALRQFEKNYAFSPASTNISFILAQTLVGEGEKYNPLVSDAYHWDLKSALTVCLQATGKYPESLGGKNCQSLIKQITTPSLAITAEYAVVPDQLSLGSLSYRNSPCLWFRIVKADPENYPSTLSGLNREEAFNYLISRETVKSWQVSLPDVGDYQAHRLEFAIPAIPAGYYLLLASADSLFRNSTVPFSYQEIWSTCISYISQRNEKGGIDLYLLDRTSGFPLKNLFVEAFSKTYDSRNRQYVFSKTGEYRSDDTGFLTIPASAGRGSYTNLILHIHHNEGQLISQPLYVYPRVDRPERTVEQTRFFTDRAIYRPGQPIYFKGIVLERTGDSISLKTNKKTKVTFTNVNGQKISEQDFITDDWGAFHGSFTAPSGVLLGDMRIFNESGSISIDVEEYKRPIFEVRFDPVHGNYMLGQQVTITGKADGYAGNAIDAGVVTYRVVRTARYPFRGDWWHIPFPESPETEITSGLTSTGTDGSFAIVFTAIPDGTIPAERQPVFVYQIYADVTDINGETRSARESLSVGYTSLLIDITLPEKLNLKSDGNFKLTTTNLNGEKTPAEVLVSLQKLNGPDRAFKERLWSRADTQILSRKAFYADFPHDIYANDDDPATWAVEKEVFNVVMNTASDTVLNLTDARCQIPDKKSEDALSGIRNPGSGIQDPGSYKLTLSATDPFGQKVEKILYFTSFDPDSKKIPVLAFNWFVPLKTTGEPGEIASFLIGTSEKEIRVIQEIRVKDELVSREWVALKNQQKRIDVPILEAYRGNFAVNFLFVRDNRVYQNNQVVSVPYTNKKLDIAFETFRNKLKPGEQEEWKIRVTNAGGRGVIASLVATMYDRSLDLFRSNSWSFDLYRQYYYGSTWNSNDDFKTTGGSWYGSWMASVFYDRVYDQLNWFGMQPMGYGSYRDFHRKGGAEVLEYKVSMDAEPVVAGMEEPHPPPMDNVASIEQQKPFPVVSPENKQIPVVLVRTAFRETAFFYPSLVTDSTGTLFLKFTVPDALTSWKVLGLAYTNKLDWGLVEKDLVTQKDLMVFPNVPRFVRQGDTLMFITRIVNLSDHEITGEANLNLAEAITMQSLNQLILDTGYRIPDPGSANSEQQTANSRTFTIPAGQSTSVSWTLAVPVSRFISLLQYTVTARAGEFSDGETNILPVLTNRMLVTETLPLPVNGKGTTDFRFEKLLRSAGLKSLSSSRLTLEFASNPAWYAIQALPFLDEKSYKNTDQVFGAFYANALASHIIGFNPRIQQVVESWKVLTPDALLSNLEKNEALKSAILQETPWVMEARNETERKQRLGQFFDRNNLQNNLNENLTQLLQMQYPSGGWPWFEGMQENRIVTLNILTGLGRLNHLGVRYPGEDSKVTDMAGKAMDYLDTELVKEYQRLQKNYSKTLKDNHLTPFIVKYLYTRSFFTQIPDPGSRIQDLSVEFNQALEYYTSQAKKFWLKQDLYSQGMIALALYRMGDLITPAKILKSLSERALHSPELGMYWAVGNGYEWYQAPVEIQALLIEAFNEVGRDNRSMEEMKIWLLKQKQTQLWKTRQATVDACYALLLRGTDLLAEDPNVVISLGDLVVDPSTQQDLQQEAGTGYFRISWSGIDITPDMGNISITKSSDGIAWGGLYWQYFENLDKVTQYETPLTLGKEIFLENNTEAGPVLVPITNDELRMTNDTSFHHVTMSPSHHLEIGDKLIVRLIVTVDRNMEFIHLKDMRAAGLEPVSGNISPAHQLTSSPALSGYRYQDGLGYYQSTTDLATNFFFDYLPKGTWVFEYPLVVNNAGDFSTGIATIQCMYAPEFSAHSEGRRIEIAR
ncbi:MAG: hypothetical protein D4R67_01015 [Bacteroidetes bacterium]|nr:MAG: hypothetical protein D4R67_01015 [Bacteroidota bacterium]